MGGAAGSGGVAAMEREKFSVGKLWSSLRSVAIGAGKRALS